MKRPRSRRRVNRHDPCPSCQMIFRRSPLFRESKKYDRSADPSSRSPARVEQGWESRSACRCVPSPATPAPLSESGSSQRLQSPNNPQQRVHAYIAIDNNTPAVRAHDLHLTVAMADSTTPVRMPELRHNLCFHKLGCSAGAAPDAVLTFARRPPPREQLRRQEPVAPCDGRNAIAGSEAFLDDPPLCIHAEPAASASVHDLEELEIIPGRIAIHTTCN